MKRAGKEVQIPLDHIRENLVLTISSDNAAKLCEQPDAEEHGEATWQLTEGCEYEFAFSDAAFTFEPRAGIVRQSRSATGSGMLRPNTYTGTLHLEIVQSKEPSVSWPFHLEVRSIKLSYRSDYRFMLASITEHCADLLLLHTSPAIQHLEPDYEADPTTLYQRFSFVKSLIESDEFTEAVHRILFAPSTKRKADSEEQKTIAIRRFGKKEIRQFQAGSRRIATNGNSLLSSVPERMRNETQTATTDTHENRFVKYVLEHFLYFCTDIEKRVPTTRTGAEARRLMERLETHLQHDLFRSVAPPTTLKLNSPILQRSEGYREVLRAWLLFDLAAKLIWKGGDDVYSGGKRDVAALYEYWVFFLLLDAIKRVFHIAPESLAELIEETKDGLGLKLKRGSQTTVSGVSDTGSRKLNVEFAFNRTFSKKAYPEGGSWSSAFRPDYTLSLWPAEMSAEEAEEQELIVHIHFDAKYKTEYLFNEDVETEETDDATETREERRNRFKRDDLMKMHVYRDAIRRTAGAYVIYPGNVRQEERGFRELLPGLGAFAVSPSRTGTGIAAIEQFILEVREHLMNRASQREHLAAQTFAIHRNDPITLASAFPEFDHLHRRLIPDSTTVLVGYYKSQEHLQWCETTGLYNFRSGNGRGALQLTPEVVGARYLLLHSKAKFTTELWEIVGYPHYWSKKDLADAGYPGKPGQAGYLVLNIQRPAAGSFDDLRWDVSQFEASGESSRLGFPFHVTLTELLQKAIS